jgi:hypothetical protein
MNGAEIYLLPPSSRRGAAERRWSTPRFEHPYGEGTAIGVAPPTSGANGVDASSSSGAGGPPGGRKRYPVADDAGARGEWRGGFGAADGALAGGATLDATGAGCGDRLQPGDATAPVRKRSDDRPLPGLRPAAGPARN